MIVPNGMLLLGVVVLAALSAAGLAYALLFSRIEGDKARRRRFDEVQRNTPADRSAARAVDPARRRKSLQEMLKELEAERKSDTKKSSISITRRIEQAGLSWSRRTFYIISAVIGAVAAGLCVAVGFPAYAAAAIGIAGTLGLPRWVVNRLRKRRLNKFQMEFANAIDVIVRGVKAGLPLTDCIGIVASEAPEPIKGEFVRIVESQKMGVSISDAVARMPDQVPISEVNFFAIAIGIQQVSGGNLSEALSNLSSVLRERQRMKGKISAMSMEAKASAAIIAALPFVVMVMVYVTSPDYIMLLFTDQLGHVMLGAGAFWMTLGVIVMRKMISLTSEARGHVDASCRYTDQPAGPDCDLRRARRRRDRLHAGSAVFRARQIGRQDQIGGARA